MGFKKHISLYLGRLAHGGIETCSLALSEVFLRNGHRVDLVVNGEGGYFYDDIPDGCRLINLNASRPRELIYPLRKYIVGERPDLLVANGWPITAAAVISKMLSGGKTKLMLCERNDLRTTTLITDKDRKILKYFGRMLFRQADAVTAVSQGVAESLEATSGFPKERVSVIYNPLRRFEETDFLPQDRELVEWWSSGSSKLLAAGSLSVVKDHDILLDAIRRVSDDRGVRLIILGEGGRRTALERQIEQQNLGGIVRLPGFRKDPYPFYKSADLFVLSSRSEGFPNVLKEALACGVPVVSTDCKSGPAELLQNGRLGTLVPVGMPDALAQGIVTALGETHDRAALKRRASDFAPEEIANRHLNLVFQD